MKLNDINMLAAVSGLARWARDAVGNVRGLILAGKKVVVPIVIAQSAVPVAVVSSGTIAPNGTITLQSALPMVYSAGVWVRLPAGAVVGGIAGLYWCVFSSAKIGVVSTAFVDTAQPFTPFVPDGAPAAAVGSGTAYTQSVGIPITVVNVPIAGGAMGPNGAIRTIVLGSRGGTGGTAYQGFYFGGLDFASVGAVVVANVTWAGLKPFANRGVQNMQVTPFYTNEGVSTSSAPPQQYSVNTAVAQTLAHTIYLSNAADCIVLDQIRVELIPGD